MGKNRLNKKHAVYTAKSGTTKMINYDRSRQILEVQFIEGDIYHYLHVPEKIWKDFLKEVKAGGSSGTFVNKIIKPVYKFIKIESPA